MSKVQFFVLKEDLPVGVEVLHDAGLLHIEQLHLSKLMEQRGISRIGLSPEQEKEKISSQALLKQTDELISYLKPLVCSCVEGPAKLLKEFQDKPGPQLIEIVNNQLKNKIDSFKTQLTKARDELAILPQYKQILGAFAASKKELKIHQDLACLALIFDSRFEKETEFFKKHLEEKTKTELRIYIAPFDPKRIIALVFYTPAIARQIDEEIFKKGTIKIDLPKEFLNRPLNDTVGSIQKRIEQVPKEIERLNNALLEFAKGNISLICSIKTIALNRLNRIEVLNNFLQLKYTIAISGWLPSGQLNRLSQTLEKSIGKNFAIYDRTNFVKRPQDIPVLLENPRILRPYQLLLSLLPPPKYGTMDATGLVSLFFPLFFGLIVGDIGYGLIFLSTALFLKKSAKFLIKSVGSILFTASISSIFFGILFGEFFGNLGKEYFRLPHILFDRHEAVIPFLILALSIGVFHIVLGFILGIIADFHKRHRKEWLEKITILAGLAGLFLLVGAMVKILPSKFLPPSIALLIIGTIILIILRGFLGPLELISAVANIFSYARLMALGLAGVMMANIANHIGGLSENIFIGIIVASLLHALNLVLSVFSPTIQSLRLHYVEFFSKFYEPGGKKYEPFRKREVEECIF